MFDGVVLGVDPGTASVGLAAVALARGRPSIRWWTTVRTPTGMSPADRLRRIYREVRSALDANSADVLAVERLMWGRNARSAMEVARASGVVILAAAERGIEVQEYAPLEVKMAVTGAGNAGKDQVRRALSRIMGIDGVPSSPDAADAVAVAVCHLHQARLRATVGAGARGSRGSRG